MITGKNYIGHTLKASGNNTYKTLNPKLNLENPTQFIDANQEEINEAVTLAWEAFKVYRKISGVKKAAFLNTIADEILALDQDLINIYMSESGLPEGRANGERGRTIFQLRTFATLVENEDWKDIVIDKAIPDRQPLPKPDLRKTSIPLGPIAVFGASNFPFAFSTAGGDTASALAAGCPVIVKSHPMHSGTGELVASAIIKAAQKTGMPNGVFSNLNGKNLEVGASLVKHPKVKAVGFTGSIKGGRALFNIASQREEPIPVFAEMGSINPVVIMPQALKHRAESIATTYANSITLGTGQFCTNPGLLLLTETENTEAFINNLGKKTIAIDAQCMLHPNIKSGYTRNSKSATSQRGIKIISKLENIDEPNFAPSQINRVSGTYFLENPKLHQEVFGPFSLVVVAKNEAELLQIINQLEGQLTGTIIADKADYSNLETIINALEDRVGRLIFNGAPTGVEVCTSMQHGGPYPASTDSRFTAVGANSIKRWIRPVSYQSFPNEFLPEALKK